jgi:putative transposase
LTHSPRCCPPSSPSGPWRARARAGDRAGWAGVAARRPGDRDGLGAELTEHLGYPAGEAPRGGGGQHPQRLDPEDAAARARPRRDQLPRDRKASFEPKLVGKRQTRLAGLDERILGLYAGGMSVRDIAQHLTDLYGTEIGRDTVSRVTDAVLEDVAAWRTRSLEAVYPIVYFDCLMVKVREDRLVRTRACYVAIGVTVEGEREPLGIWWQESEGAKFWFAVLNDLHQRGVRDVLICCVDGLAGFPEAIEAVFPQAWVQTCIVHQIRSSMRYVAYPRPQAGRRGPEADLPRPNLEAAEQALASFEQRWGERYPMIADSWRAAGSTSRRSWPCPPNCAARSTPPTASRTSTRPARRSRPAATSPTSRPPPSSST